MHELFTKRKVFYWVVAVTIVVSAIIIYSIPRYYKSSVSLAPEAQSSSNIGGVAALASSFGINFGNMASEDAIYPNIYPDVISSQDFLVSICEEQVQTLDNSFTGSVFDYYKDCYRDPWWGRMIGGAKRKLMSLFVTPEVKKDGHINSYQLSKSEYSVIKRMGKNIQCIVDANTSIITITVSSQDAQVSAQIAQYVCTHLQDFIIIYRTRKATNDINYYTALANQAKVEYEQAKSAYVAYADSHTDVNRHRYQIEDQNMRNEMEMRYANYEGYVRQRMLAQAKYQEHIPIYTIISNASIPVRASGPRRVLFILAMCIIACFGTSVWLIRDELLALL